MIVPTALAVAEECGATGEMLCAAVVVGYEMAFRAARCINFGVGSPPIDPAREYRACGSWGAATCAAIAAHLLRLPKAAIPHALGIADYHSPDAPMMRDLETPTMVKHANGIGAMTGIQSASLASRGFTGIVSRLYWEPHAPWVSDLGREYFLPNGASWKRFSCCSFAHAAVDAVGRLRQRHGAFADRIRHIRVRTYSDAIRLGAGVPDTSEQAQFSLSWPLAVMAMDGEVHPRAMMPSRLSDSRTRALAACVEIAESADLTALYLKSEAEQPGGEEAAVLEIELSRRRHGAWTRERDERALSREASFACDHRGEAFYSGDGGCAAERPDRELLPPCAGSARIEQRPGAHPALGAARPRERGRDRPTLSQRRNDGFAGSSSRSHA